MHYAICKTMRTSYCSCDTVNSQTVTLQLERINSYTCCSVEFVEIKTGRTLRSSSINLEQPCENSFTHLYTALRGEHLSP
ncbi:hypothetical protein TNCT_434761 [Trichonephila clavata]|uniref:Uncharacterized protein n=1 Tax=Trichonephila clavata TaxID=2740835 RepID=A0A8X6FJK7_TRICU|nr:hypothetical protein TNCT_434761 [Trichonephila clavata]